MTLLDWLKISLLNALRMRCQVWTNLKYNLVGRLLIDTQKLKFGLFHPNICPRTKHIALKYHHFREHVRKGLIKINPIDTLEQVAGIFTKALPFPIFNYLSKKMMGWSKQ